MTLRHRILSANRRAQLKELLDSKANLRVIEAHNGLSALVGSNASVVDEYGQAKGFDGLWVSSLTDSAAKGHPDTEVIDTSSRLETIQQLLQVTDKFIIVDGDTGGDPTQFEYFCSKLENLGVSAVIIEDKQYPKRNSLEKDAIQVLEDPEEFATKVNRAKAVCLSDDFMIFTRIESFIAGRGLEDAIERARIYLQSNADGIFIHSNAKDTSQIDAFMSAYEVLCDQMGIRKPVVCVPTTYNQVYDHELFEKGVSIVIYANHQLRACYRAMEQVCRSILTHQRSFEASEHIAPIKDIMDMVGFPDVKSKDVQYRKNPLPVVILGSGQPTGFKETLLNDQPVSNLPIAGLPLLQRQVTTLKDLGFNDITLVSGYGREKLPEQYITEIHNPAFAETKVANSLMKAREKLSPGFIMIFGDIIFDGHLLKNYLLNFSSDILLLVDNSFNLNLRQRIKPSADLVEIERDQQDGLRRPNIVTEQVRAIGHELPLDRATHEFIGIAKFSAKGAEHLMKAYDELLSAQTDSVAIDFNRLINHLIESGVSVDAVVVNQGWSEVHSLNDIASIEKEINRQILNQREKHVATSAY